MLLLGYEPLDEDVAGDDDLRAAAGSLESSGFNQRAEHPLARIRLPGTCIQALDDLGDLCRARGDLSAHRHGTPAPVERGKAGAREPRDDFGGVVAHRERVSGDLRMHVEVLERAVGGWALQVLVKSARMLPGSGSGKGAPTRVRSRAMSVARQCAS